MCGIIGALTFEGADAELEAIRQEAMMFLVTELTQQTQPRGEDATGMATLFENGHFMGLKMGVEAAKLISRRGGTDTDYDGYLKLWRAANHHGKHPRNAKIHIAHCRKTSVGNCWDNVNNHPIVVDPIVGIHNGTLKNHDIIFKRLDSERSGEVDSEVIIRMFKHFTNGGKLPFTQQMIEEVCMRLEGTFACLIFNANNPYQLASFRDGRPVEFMLVKPLKMVIVASEKNFLDIALYRYNKMAALYATENKWPILKAGDTQSKTLADETIALWDLTVEVTDKTDIADLYDYRSLPRVGKKWQKDSDIQKRTGGAARDTERKTYTHPKVPAITGNGASTEVTVVNPSDDELKLGLVWSKSLNSFRTIIGVAKTRELGAVEMNVDDGKIINVFNENSDSSDTNENSDNSDANENPDYSDATGDPETETNTIVDDKPTDINLDEDNNEGDFDGVSDDPTVVNEVVIQQIKDAQKPVDIIDTVDEEAIEKAEIAVGYIPRFEDNEDVAMEADILDAETVVAMPAFGLANRIRRLTYKLGWYDGYVANKIEKPSQTSEIGKEFEKTIRQQGNIRILKSIARAFSAVLNRKQLSSSQSLTEEIGKAMSNDTELRMENIRRLFSPGDIRKDKALAHAVETIETKEKRK